MLRSNSKVTKLKFQVIFMDIFAQEIWSELYR